MSTLISGWQEKILAAVWSITVLGQCYRMKLSASVEIDELWHTHVFFILFCLLRARTMLQNETFGK